MTDIAERLRADRPQFYESTMREAADELERLQVQLEEVKALNVLLQTELAYLNERYWMLEKSARDGHREGEGIPSHLR